MGVPVAFGIGLISASVCYNISINIMSMIGFIVVLGIVVDDAIVFSENSYRYLEQGFSPKDAVVKGIGEVLPSVFFAILTTVSAVLCMLLSNVNDAVAIAKNQLLPELNFTVSYRKAESKNQLNNSYDAPLDNFCTGLEFRLPLNQKPEKARVKEAILNAQSLDINRQEVEQNLLFISREKFFLNGKILKNSLPIKLELQI